MSRPRRRRWTIGFAQRIANELDRRWQVMVRAAAGSIARLGVLTRPGQGKRAPAVAEHPARLRILLVDDDELVRTTVARVLANHDVTSESDGEAAIARIAAADFDLVLCDLMMPGKSGMDVYQAVVDTRPELARRFVFISGGASTPEAERFLEAHASERLDKPFGMDALRRVVAEAAQRRDEREP